MGEKNGVVRVWMAYKKLCVMISLIREIQKRNSLTIWDTRDGSGGHYAK